MWRFVIGTGGSHHSNRDEGNAENGSLHGPYSLFDSPLRPSRSSLTGATTPRLLLQPHLVEPLGPVERWERGLLYSRVMPHRSAPAEGTDWRPGVSGNRVFWDGVSVVKRHVDASGYDREHAVLGELTELPVPRLLTGSRPGALRMSYIDGMNAVEAVDAGRASTLLRAMGQFLCRLHAVDPRRVSGFLRGEGEVVAHGDYGPHNALLDRESDSLIGILDWEGACLGSRALDLAWCEWQFRNRFPAHAYAIAALFEGYGNAPSPALRECALRVRLEQLRAGVSLPIESKALRMVSFARADEAAAYLASLSRFLNHPQGEPHRRAEVEIWRRESDETPIELFMTDAAARASIARFGPLPEASGFAHHPTHAVRVLRGDDTPPMGMTEAMALLGLTPSKTLIPFRV